jgi:hypothetical protein
VAFVVVFGGVDDLEPLFEVDGEDAKDLIPPAPFSLEEKGGRGTRIE